MGGDYPHGACWVCCLVFNLSWRKPSVSQKKQAKINSVSNHWDVSVPVANVLSLKGGRKALAVILVYLSDAVD